jgi:hypothetical protein
LGAMQERQDQPPSDAKQRLKDWVFPAAGFVAALLAIYTFVAHLAPEQLDRGDAAAYLRSHFDTAVRDPSKAFDAFDDNFRSHHPKETRSVFVADFHGIYRAVPTRVRDETNGVYSATVTYCHKHGAVKVRTEEFTLKCSRWSALPFVACGDISIHDITQKKKVKIGYVCPAA